MGDSPAPKPRYAGVFQPGYDPRRGRSASAKRLRHALALCGDEVHEALMALVRQGDKAAVIYAHSQLIGKPPERSVDDAAESPTMDLSALTVEELIELKRLQAKMAIAQPLPPGEVEGELVPSK